jgi:phosphoglycerate dehydrogenase-like enzyme
MPHRIAISPDFAVEARGQFERVLERELGGRADLTFHVLPVTPDKIIPAGVLNDYDALFLLAYRVTEETLKGVDRLAVVARWGVGYDNVDTAACTKAGVVLAITPGGVRRSVAESVVTFIFALGLRLIDQDRVVREGKWRGALPRYGQCVQDRVLGLLGCGNIGGEIFRMCRSLGFRRMIAHDPYLTPAQAADLGVESVSMEELFAQSDYLSVNCPLNDETRGLVNAKWLRTMKPSAYLINTARGPIVNQADLALALREGWIAGAGLDVFEVEPLPAADPIRDCPNVIFAPHGLCWTEEMVRDNSRQMFDNALAVLRGEAPLFPVNRDVLDTPAFQAKLQRYRSL